MCPTAALAQVLSARPAATRVMKPSRLAALLALDDSDSEPEEVPVPGGHDYTGPEL